MNGKRTRRVVSLLLVAVTVLVAFSAGCGPAPTPVVEEKVVEVTVEVEKPVEVEVEKEIPVTVTPVPLPEDAVKVIRFHTDETDPDSVAVYEEVFAEFEELHPDVRVDLVLTDGSDEMERLITAQMVGDDLGIIRVHTDLVPAYADAGYLLPLDDMVEAIGEEDIKPNAAFKYQDHYYAFAVAGGTHGTLWLRMDLLEQAGFDHVPNGIDEWLAAAEGMTRDTNGDGVIDVYGVGLPAGPTYATSARFAAFMYQNCGDYFDKQGNLTFDNPGVLKALKDYVALLEYAPPDTVEWGWWEGIYASIAGKVAMHPMGGRLGVMMYETAPELRDNTRVVPLIVGDVCPGCGRGAYDYQAISSTARYPEETKELLTYVLTGDREARFCMTVPSHLIPPLYSVDKIIATMDNEYTLRYPEDVQALFSSVEIIADPMNSMGAMETDTCTFNPTVNPMPWAACVFSGVIPIDAEMIQRVFINGESPEEAWEWAYTEMQKCADEWKAEHPDWKPRE